MAQPPGVEDVAAGGCGRAGGELALDGPQDARAVVDRRAERAQAPEGERAGDEETVGLRGEPLLPQRERGGVGRRLRRRAAAVQPHSRQRVPAMTTGAVRAVGEAGADGAHEPVVVEVQDDARAGLLRRGERAPAERRVDVVGVDDPRAAAPHRVAHLVRSEPAAQQPRRGLAAGQRRGVVLEHLGVLAELLADQPREVLDRALLATGDAVAVVQEQDHVARSVRGRPIAPQRSIF